MEVLCVIAGSERFTLIDLKDFNVSIILHYRQFLHLAFQSCHFQFRVHPFGLFLSHGCLPDMWKKPSNSHKAWKSSHIWLTGVCTTPVSNVTGYSCFSGSLGPAWYLGEPQEELPGFHPVYHVPQWNLHTVCMKACPSSRCGSSGQGDCCKSSFWVAVVLLPSKVANSFH